MGDPREDEDVTEHPLANYPRPPPRGEDLPYDDGEPMETLRHRLQMNVLIESLDENRDGSLEFFVSGNQFLYFSETQAKKNDFRGPDVFVVLGRPQQDVKSWVVWEQDGHLPDVIIELLSPKTEKVDRGEKFRIYRDVMKVARYYLYDPYTFDLEGYALVDGVYQRLEPNADGRLECRPLGLWLGVRDTFRLQHWAPMLRWFDAEGQVLLEDRERAGDFARRAEEEARRAEEEARRAEEEARRADAAEARAAELERRLAELEQRK